MIAAAETREPRRHFRLALCLGAAGAASTMLLLPYLLALMPGILSKAQQAGIGLPLVIGVQLAQALVVLTLASWAGLRVGRPMGLDAPILRAWVYGTSPAPLERRTIALACAIGLAGGAAVVALDHAFHPWMPAAKAALPVAPGQWKGFLAAFYGGIGEELQVRLFLMTLLMWLAWKLLARGRRSPPPVAAWTAIGLAALAFGAGHLPAAAQVWPLDAIVVLRTLSLNAMVGVACGWLFYRYGLEHAMCAHFCADIVLHVMAG
ncbi:MAG TPA: CPBP family intramembrane glutamic endopeptidase [Usitatibacter sp.]|nr:CPBP family intramembrane glutamic endopeptidase [Usitatibacter sp.]